MLTWRFVERVSGLSFSDIPAPEVSGPLPPPPRPSRMLVPAFAQNTPKPCRCERNSAADLGVSYITGRDPHFHTGESGVKPPVKPSITINVISFVGCFLALGATVAAGNVVAILVAGTCLFASFGLLLQKALTPGQPPTLEPDLFEVERELARLAHEQELRVFDQELGLPPSE